MKHNEVYTEAMIVSRLEEAASTMKRLPAVKVQGYVTWWPDIVYSEIEKLQMELKPEKWAATPEKIARMEEACRWLRLIPRIEDRRLLWLRAERIRWKLICTTFGIGRTAANNRWKNALRMILFNLLKTN